MINKWMILLAAVGLLCAAVARHYEPEAPVPVEAAYKPPQEVLDMAETVSNAIELIEQQRRDIEEYSQFFRDELPVAFSNAFNRGVMFGSYATTALGCENMSDPGFDQQVRSRAWEGFLEMVGEKEGRGEK